MRSQSLREMIIVVRICATSGFTELASIWCRCIGATQAFVLLARRGSVGDEHTIRSQARYEAMKKNLRVRVSDACIEARHYGKIPTEQAD